MVAAVHIELMQVLSNPLALVGMMDAKCDNMVKGTSTVGSQLPLPSTVSDREGPTEDPAEQGKYMNAHTCVSESV